MSERGDESYRHVHYSQPASAGLAPTSLIQLQHELELPNLLSFLILPMQIVLIAILCRIGVFTSAVGWQ